MPQNQDQIKSALRSVKKQLTLTILVIGVDVINPKKSIKERLRLG